MLWVDNPDPHDWKYKRRHTILGLWHQLKQQLYAQYQDAIDGEEEAARAAAAGTLRPAPF